MPVVTRSCGRQGVRRRMEDPTPRRPRTTIKRKKIQSDEETEKPAKKKANTLTVTIEKLLDVTPPEKQSQASRIPRPCTAKKTTPENVNTNENYCELNERDENSETNEKSSKLNGRDENSKTNENSCKLNERDESYTANENDVNTTPVAEKSPASSPPASDAHMNLLTPVAARTRSFSALKRSYRAKKAQRNANNNCTVVHHNMSISEGTAGRNDANRTPEATSVNEPSQDVVSSSCGSVDKDVEMTEEQENQEEATNGKQKTDDFYKTKFHEMMQHVKNIQEGFDNAQVIASKNINAYDSCIKELKDSLEKEKAHSTTTTEELQNTKEQLVAVQKELEQTRKQHTEMNMQADTSNKEHEKGKSLELKVKFLEMLSGITLSQEPDSVESFESYCCVYKPKGFKGKAMKFRLTYDKEIEEVEFSPVAQTPSSGEFLQTLPRYLRENIYFSTDQAPSFLLRLIQTSQKQQ